MKQWARQSEMLLQVVCLLLKEAVGERKQLNKRLNIHSFGWIPLYGIFVKCTSIPNNMYRAGAQRYWLDSEPAELILKCPFCFHFAIATKYSTILITGYSYTQIHSSTFLPPLTVPHFSFMAIAIWFHLLAGNFKHIFISAFSVWMLCVKVCCLK